VTMVAPAAYGCRHAGGRPPVSGGPVRTCIGCRQRRAATDLIRLQVDDGYLHVVDRPVPGRSAYLCPSQACLERAVQRRAFARTLRQDVRLDDGLPVEFREAVKAREAVR